jgi:propanol-preferring alcohol dehydrogenase
VRAAVVEEFGKLVIKDVPKPSPGHEEALVKISSAGVCHSDLHMANGDWPGMEPPFHLGHEAIGVVEELGPGAEAFVEEGDRVILGLGGAGGGYWCGACENCLSGKPQFCRQRRNMMNAYGEYVSIWVKALVKLPDSVGDREVPLACGGLTAYSSIKKLLGFGVLPGSPIAIVGAAGGLGHYAIQIAKAFGYKVVGVDVGEEKLEFVKSMGADYAEDASEAAKSVKKKVGGACASIVYSPKVAGFELGLKLLRRGGVFIGVGMPAANEGAISISPLELLGRSLIIATSFVGTVQEMRELVQLAADGKVKTHVSRTAGLSELAQVFEELEKGQYAGRAIIDNMKG